MAKLFTDNKLETVATQEYVDAHASGTKAEPDPQYAPAAHTHSYNALTDKPEIIAPLDAPVEMQTALTQNIPFDSIILKPTAASFNVNYALLLFKDWHSDQMVAVVFVSAPYVAILGILGIADPVPGMSIVKYIEDMESGEIICLAVTQVTDGTNILLPQVNLAEITGITEATLVGVTEYSNQPFFQGDEFSLTAIDGVDFAFRFPLTGLLQWLAQEVVDMRKILRTVEEAALEGTE